MSTLLLQFPEPYRHDHPPVQDVNELLRQGRTFGARMADWVALTMGSWRFLIGQTAFLTVWIVLNILAWNRQWDPYPFILMNLVLSVQAAYAAPIIMMSQNRQADRDRLEAHNAYLINQKAESEIRAVLDHLAAQDRMLAWMHAKLEGRSFPPADALKPQASPGPEKPVAEAHGQ
jgi:uncharacterized membrane protein